MAEPAADDPRPDAEPLTLAEFGRRFLETAVTKERVEQAVSDLAGRPIDVGPMNVAPLGFVKVRAKGAIDQPVVAPRPDDHHVVHGLTIPARLQMQIQVGLETYRFDADTAIHLTVTARPIAPLRIFIDVAPPTPADIEVDLRASGLGASLLDKLAGVEREVRRNVVKFVAAEIDKSHAKRVIDIAATVAGSRKHTTGE